MVICAVLSTILIGVIYLRSSRLPTLEIEKEKMDAQWHAIDENKIRDFNLENHLEKLNSIDKEIEERLMSIDSKAINYQYFYKLEKSSKVRIEALNQRGIIASDAKTPELEYEFFQPIEFTVTAAGNFKQVMDFLYKLQHGMYFTLIKNFSCSQNFSETENLISLSITLEVFGAK